MGKFSAPKFTLVPRDNFRGVIDPNKIEELQEIHGMGSDSDGWFARRTIDANEGTRSAVSTARMKVEAVLSRLIHCTFLQSEDPVWFLIRAFKFTSRTSDSFFRAVSKFYTDAPVGISRLIKGARLSPLTAPLPNSVEEVMDMIEIKFSTVCDVLNLRRCDGQDSGTDMAAETRTQELSEI